MSKQLTLDDFKESLSSHIAAKAAEIRAKYGPDIGWEELLRILEDRSAVRYPCEIVFKSSLLLSGEFAHPVPNGEAPEEGFKICVHPVFSSQLARVPSLVLYQLVLVNYGPFVSSYDAEVFGAGVLGITTDEYYSMLCTAVNELSESS